MRRASFWVVLLSLSPFAQAKVVYVNAGASGAVRDGYSWAHAFLRVGDGLAAASSGDEVWVARGTYVEILAPGDGISVYGGFAGTETERGERNVPANVTVLSGVRCETANVLVDGFTFRGADLAVDVWVGSLTLSNNTFAYNTVGVHGPVVVTRNTFYGNGIAVKADGSAKITGNIFYSNDSAVSVVGGFASIYNNTISRNVNGITVSAGTAAIANNIVAFGTGAGVQATGGIVAFLAHNDVYTNAGGDYSGFAPDGVGNISVDPKLSPALLAPHIQPGSPCIDAGMDTVAYEAEDMDGEPRVQGAHVDIGADESDGTVWTFTPTIWHVSPAGSDGSDGSTWAKARKTIAAALATARPGDEVWVAAGTYLEKLTPPPGAALYGGFAGTETERAQRDWKRNATMLGPRNSYPAMVECKYDGIVMDGFTITDDQCGVLVSSGLTTLANNAIVGSAGLSDGVEVTSDGSTLGTLVAVGNVIRDSFIGVSMRGGSATLLFNVLSHNETGVDARPSNWAPGAVVAALTGNEISENTSKGVDVAGEATLVNNRITRNGGDGLTVSRRATLLNNTITANQNGVAVLADAATMLTNNIVAYNRASGVLAASTAGITFSHNDAYGNGGGDTVGFTPAEGAGNISVDPMLASPYRDLHLQPGSPCIDAGDGAPVWMPTDFDGQPRIQGAGVDIGADESDGTSRTVTPATWYVSPSGNDASDGRSWASAKRSIPGALAAAEYGDELWVAAGAYADSFRFPSGVALYGGFAGSETARTERNQTANPAVIGGLSTAIRVEVNTIDTVLDGFVVQNCHVDVSCGPALLAHNAFIGPVSPFPLVVASSPWSTVVISDNAITGGVEGISADGPLTVVTGNRIRDCRENGVSAGTNTIVQGNSIEGCATGVYVVGSATITNNMIAACGTGVDISAGSDYRYPVHSTASLTNNTLAGNTAGVTVDYGCTAGLANNIIAFSSGAGVMGYELKATFSHNDVFANAGGNYLGIAPPSGEGSISLDPLFVNRASGDYHLQAGSPCINAGDDTVAAAGETDLEGLPRIAGVHVDIGAYEYPLPASPLGDVRLALRMAAGLAAGSPDAARLDVVPGQGVDVRDAVALLRRALGPS